jgi:Mce-associated membrane protein
MQPAAAKTSTRKPRPKKAAAAPPATAPPAGVIAPAAPGVTAPAGAVAPPAWPESTPQPYRLIGAIGLLVVLLLVGALVFSVLRINHEDSANSLRNSALSAAKTYGVYLSSYNYKDLTSPTAAWTQVDDHADAGFRRDFNKTSSTLKALLTQYDATATGKVVAAGIETLTSSRAVVLLFIDQTVTNTVQKPNSVTQPLRVELTMVRQGGRWLIDNLQVPT